MTFGNRPDSIRERQTIEGERGATVERPTIRSAR